MVEVEDIEKLVSNSIETVRPLVEKEFGSLPHFGIQKGAFINDFPFRIDPDYRKNEWIFRYYPRWWEEKIGSNSDYLFYAFTHDLIHLYQQENYSKRLGKLRVMPKLFHFFYAQFFIDWIEGVADLSTWKIVCNILNSSENSSELDDAGFKKEFFYKKMAIVLSGLKQEHIINLPDVESLNLPFTLPQETTIFANNLAAELKIKKSDRYARGLLRSARVISNEGITLQEILRMPMSNYELKERAGV